MPNEIRHKTSTTTSAVPTAAQLTAGELAVNAASGKVYTKKADGTVVDLTDVQIMDGGEQFTPLAVSNLALWLDASDTNSVYTTDAGAVTAVAAPTDIANCKLWLDADDASTFTLASGAVSEWRDKSNSGVPHATQASASLRPTRTTNALNNRAVVSFQSSHSLSFVNSTASFNFLHNSVGGTIFIVIKPFASTAPNAFAYALNNSNNNSSSVGLGLSFDDRSGFSRNNAVLVNINRGVSNALVSGSVLNNFFASADAYALLSLVLDNSNATAANRAGIFLNGIAAAPANTSTNSPAATNASTDMIIGTLSPPTTDVGGISGGIAEIIFYEGVLSSANRARVEKYLALKWGLQDAHKPVSQELTAVTTPLDLQNCAMWLDASDASTLFTDTARTVPVTTSGNIVAGWADKSGAGAHAAATGTALRPTYQVTTVNGRSALLFDGVDDALVVSAANRPAAENYTILCVYRTTANPVIGGTPISVKDTASFRSISATTGNINWYATSNDLTATVNTSFGSATGIIGYTNANNSVIVYKDGSAVSGTITSNAAVSTTAGLQIGRREAALEPFPGYICEIVYYTRVLSSVERVRLEKYLANKWGVAGVPDPTPAVGSWYDKSGNARHATQAVTANRPVISTLNSRPALSFAGANSVTTPDYLAKAISTYFYVSRHTDSADTIFQTGPTNSFHSHIIESTHKFRRVETTNQGIVLGTNLGVGAPAVWCVDYSNNLISVRYNGATIAQLGSISAGGNITDSFRATTIGRLAPTETYLPLNGNVAEFMVYGGRHLSIAEKQTVERYLAAKWGITLAPQVSNLDAQDWINRVYLAGGTVTQGTAAAVNNFCDAINAAGIRDRFYRLNLFCGDNLTACLVPLYRGTSLTATQLGNVTDTNTNFVASDYNERDGLRATATGNETATKTLDCGTNIISALPNSYSGHIAAAIKLIPGATMTQQPISQCLADANTPAEPQVTQYRLSMTSASALEHIVGGIQQVNRTLDSGSRYFSVASRIDQNVLSAYLDGANKSQNTAPISTTRTILSNARLAIFGTTNGSGPASAAFKHIVSHFSFGLSMTDSQVLAYSNAVTAFNAAIGRT